MSKKEPKLAIASSYTHGTYYKEHSHILTNIHMHNSLKCSMIHDEMQYRYDTKTKKIKAKTAKKNKR
jgi:phosphoribulokinase